MLPYIERELARGTRLVRASRATCSACSAACRARARSAATLATEAVKPGAGVGVLTEALAQVVDANADLAHIAA